MIRPITSARTPINFGIKHLDGGDYNREPQSSKFNTDLKNGLIAGVFFGTILATTGTSIYKDRQINSMLKDIAAESTYAGVDTFKIKDVNNDEIPEFILVGNNGDETAFDFTSGKTYIKEDGEIIEKD